MEITLNTRYGYYIEITDTNVNISEDIESREYPKDADGKVIYSNPKRDIKTNAIDRISGLLAEMIYYRDADYDSSDLIESLFAKLPEEKKTANCKFTKKRIIWT